MASANLTEFGFVPWEYHHPQQVEPFWFEKIDGNELRLWSNRNLPAFGIICFAYFILITVGPRWMKNRKTYDLEKSLAAWNFFLSLFSLIVVIRVAPEIIQTLLQPDGYYKSVCMLDKYNYSTTFWVFLFVISKIVELGDTVFIVLRKKPLIFLHGFHHFNMAWSSNYIFILGEPMAKWVVLINSFVHTIMYAYFGLRALKIKIPQKVSMLITSLQISQFVFGLISQTTFLMDEKKGRPCFRTTDSYFMTFFFLIAYLFLFAQLFYRAYIVKGKTKIA